MLSLILAESAVEIIPESIRDHPAVVSSSRRLGRSPASTLLDVSWHHAAMARLGADRRRRGRPDIAHSALLAATGTPLYAAGRLAVYVHTARDVAIRVGPGTRLPKSQLRFAGLVGGVLAGGGAGGAASADGEDGRPLLEARPMDLAQLVGEIGPALTVGMSRSGEPGTLEGVAAQLAGAEGGEAAGKGEPAGACLVVGGFQRGGFSRRTAGLLDRTVSVGKAGLEAHVVVSRALYEYEKALGSGLGAGE